MIGKEKLIAFATAGLGLWLASRWAFNPEIRKEIQDRDHTCQVRGCRKKDKKEVQCHHLIPGILGKKRRPDHSCGIYVDTLLDSRDIIREYVAITLGSSESEALFQKMRQFIESKENGLVLCENHHVSLHDNSLGEPPKNKPGYHRPQVLNLEHIQSFFFEKVEEFMPEKNLIDYPAIVEMLK